MRCICIHAHNSGYRRHESVRLVKGYVSFVVLRVCWSGSVGAGTRYGFCMVACWTPNAIDPELAFYVCTVTHQHRIQAQRLKENDCLRRLLLKDCISSRHTIGQGSDRSHLVVYQRCAVKRTTARTTEQRQPNKNNHDKKEQAHSQTDPAARTTATATNTAASTTTPTTRPEKINNQNINVNNTQKHRVTKGTTHTQPAIQCNINQRTPHDIKIYKHTPQTTTTRATSNRTRKRHPTTEATANDHRKTSTTHTSMSTPTNIRTMGSRKPQHTRQQQHATHAVCTTQTATQAAPQQDQRPQKD